MPLYDFKCSSEMCAKEFEDRVPLTELDTKQVVCPECQKPAQRKLTAQRSTHTTWKHWRLGD